MIYNHYTTNYYLGEVQESLYESGASNKNIRYLTSGDLVEPIVYMMHSDDASVIRSLDHFTKQIYY